MCLSDGLHSQQTRNLVREVVKWRYERQGPQVMQTYLLLSSGLQLPRAPS